MKFLVSGEGEFCCLFFGLLFPGLSLITPTSFTPPLHLSLPVDNTNTHATPGMPSIFASRVGIPSRPVFPLKYNHVQVTGAKYMASTNQTFSKCLLNECKIEWIDRLVYFFCMFGFTESFGFFFLFSIIHSYCLSAFLSQYLLRVFDVSGSGLYVSMSDTWSLLPWKVQSGLYWLCWFWVRQPYLMNHHPLGAEAWSGCLGEDAEEENIIMILRL